jgi:RNA polymerase sigma-70 factor, ECF subfamily
MLDSERDRVFGEWLAAHQATLFKVVRAYAFEHADRQDLFQEVAIQVWRSVDAYRGDSSVRTWIYRIALNAAVSWTRKQDRHQRGKQPLEIVEDLLTASAAEADPRVEWLYRQIAQLKDVDRSVALLMLDRSCLQGNRRHRRHQRGQRRGEDQPYQGRPDRSAGTGNGIMNLDELTEVWRSQDLSPLYGVDKDLLHQVLRQEQAKLEKRLRRTRWFMIVVTAFLFINAALFLAIMIDPNQPPTFSARFIVWDYVVGGVGVAAALTVAGALLTARRSRQAREQGFGDSLRDHLRRRIVQLDNAATGERRLTLIIVAATLICATAISIVSGRIRHVPVPWSEIVWPSPFVIVLVFGFLYLLFFRWIPREQRNVSRKRQLEALLKELDGQ